MRRLSSLGSKQLAHRKGRSALTAIGIVLGVAILFGVLVTNATTQSGVDVLVADFAGNADVLVSPVGAFDAKMPATALQPIARLDGVKVVSGSLSFRSAIRIPGREIERDLFGQGDVSAFGIELASAQKVQPITLDAGRLFAEGAPEMVVPRRLADERGLKLEQSYRVQTPRGLAPMLLVGILTDTGSGRTNQGNVLFTSLAQARALAGEGAVLSGARLVLDDDVDVAAWIKQHKRAAPGLDLIDADTLAQGFRSFLDILGAMFTFFAAITLFVGAFLIYLTLSMAVIERTRIYGTMRALGALRRQVRRVVIAEALVLGTVSTIIGLGLGLLIAKGLIALVSNLFEIDMPGLTVRPNAVIAGIAIGIVVTTLSSLIPARRASRLSPVVAMKGDYRTDTKLSRAWMVGAVAALGGVALGMAGGSGGAVGTPLILLGAVLLVPLLLPPLARLLGAVTERIARGVGDIAVLHLVKERSRSAYTLALVMVVMAMIFSIGGLNASLSRALDDSLDRQFGSDITIDAVGSLGSTFERELASVSGVGDVTPIRFGQARAADETKDIEEVFLRIIDPATYFKVASFLFLDGTENDAKAGLGAGGMLMSVERATGLGLKVGDTFEVVTARGNKGFKLVATYQQFGGPPEMVIGIADARRYFNAGDPGAFQLNVAPGASVPAVKRAIEQQLGEEHTLAIETSDGIKQEAQKQFGQFFNIFYAIILVAGIVGLLGLANTLAMSVVQRTREIGVLRAIGVTRPQVRRMVLVESATLGLVAFALSLPLGWVLSIVTLGGVSGAFGFEVAYVYPAAWIPVVGAFGVVVAVLAAIAPGRRAAKLQVVGALQYE